MVQDIFLTLQQASPKPTASIDAIPVELRLLILHEIADISTLYNLIRASPIYYATVANTREEVLTPLIVHELEKVLTPIVLREFESRGVHLFRPYWALDLYMTGLEFSYEEIIA
ncbi:MAG: hypothetical protein Q9191_008431, partial [Dirinaria sp. TL-2023a]